MKNPEQASAAVADGAPIVLWPRKRTGLAGPRLGAGWLALSGSLLFALAYNGAFWRQVGEAGISAMGTVALAVALVALQAFLMGLLLWGRGTRPVLALLVLLGAVADTYAQRYGVYFDTGMIRNVLGTDPHEAAELLDLAMLLRVLLKSVPALAVLAWVRRRDRRPLAALRGRVVWLLVAAGVAVGALLADFGELSSLMRNRPQLRHQVAPANIVVAGARVAAEALAAPASARQTVGADAHRLAPAGARPRALVLVVGETVRAQDWGLNGYARQTTPKLAEAGVINFPDVTACGTSTEVSLPCMFSLGAADGHDRSRMRHSESVLHALARAGIAVAWRDNQSGCKGVCDGLPSESLADAKDPAHCSGSRCGDGILFEGLAARIAELPGDLVLVLHMLGNHGPAYAERYLPEFGVFTPVCTEIDLGRCPREAIVNAYDNAILQTDHLLAQAIGTLRTVTSHETALVYVSDHGESLGEGGLYLHGMPRAIAPAEQLKVPMVMWLSPSWEASSGPLGACLPRRAADPVSHTHLAHTLLGLMRVSAAEYRAAFDLSAGCGLDG